MNPAFFQHIEGILHTERIDAYRQDGADHTVASPPPRLRASA